MADFHFKPLLKLGTHTENKPSIYRWVLFSKTKKKKDKNKTAISEMYNKRQYIMRQCYTY